MGTKWQGFEKLAQQIMAELLPHATVAWDDKIYGHDTETERQIDVSIRWADQGRECLTIVQARDRKSPADVNTVGEFASVVRDVRATGGVLVCNGGFTKRAHTYANNLGIRLYNLHDATSHHWSRELTVPLVWVDLTPHIMVNWEVRLEVGDEVYPHAVSQIPPVSLDGGKTIVHILDTFERHWNEGALRRDLNALHTLNGPTGDAAMLVTDATGKRQWRPARNIRMPYTVQRRAWLGQFEPADCRGLIDHLDQQAFLASYLPAASIPAQRDDAWQPIDDPDAVAVSIRGTVVTSEGYEVLAGSGQIEEMTFKFAGPS